MSSRTLSIDYGLARIGLAISDSIHNIALPLKTLQVKSGDIWVQLDHVMQQYNPLEVVIGLPLLFDGSDSEQTRKTRQFIAAFQTRYSQCTIHPLDERLTSRQAERMLVEQGKNRKQRAKVNDETSAWILLSCFLERKNGISTKSDNHHSPNLFSDPKRPL